MKYLFTFIYSFLRSGVEAKRDVKFSHYTQCLQNLAESGERCVLTLGSLCLPCSVRDTEWSLFNFFFLRWLNKVRYYDLLPKNWELKKIIGTNKSFGLHKKIYCIIIKKNKPLCILHSMLIRSGCRYAKPVLHLIFIELTLYFKLIITFI